MKILIPTCDDYIKHVEALQHSTIGTALDSFEFIIIGFHPPKFELRPNWSFVSTGEDQGPVSWSRQMRVFLETFPDEFFIYGNDDCAISYLDEDRLNFAIKMANTYKNIGRIALMAEGRKRHVIPYFIKANHPDIENSITVNQFSAESDYRLSLGWSIYNKECFLQFCKEGITPCQFELSSCGKQNYEELAKWSFLTFNPDKEAIDAAFFRRKTTKEVVKEWDKGYYGHDLFGDIRHEIKNILFKN